MLIFWCEGKSFWHWFLLIERISKQRLLATYHNDVGKEIKSLDCSRELSVRLCAAYVQKWPFTPWRGPVTQQNVTKVTGFASFASCASFARFARLETGLPAPGATAGRRCALRIDVQRGPWILKWRRFKPSGNLALINFKTSEDANRQSFGVC